MHPPATAGATDPIQIRRPYLEAGSQVSESPKSELLAEEFCLLFRKLLVYLPQRWWEVEGRQQEVKVAEVSGGNVLVLPPLVICVCQKISGSSSLEVPNR